jgi:hypothetical protein
LQERHAGFDGVPAESKGRIFNQVVGQIGLLGQLFEALLFFFRQLFAIRRQRFVTAFGQHRTIESVLVRRLACIFVLMRLL